MKNREFRPGHCDGQEPAPQCGQGGPDLDGHSAEKKTRHHPEREERRCHQGRKESGTASELDFLLLQQLRHCGHILHHRRNDNQSQNRILLCLNHNGTMSQKQLAEHMHIQPGSLSEVVAKVESSGYIERQRSQEDRRTIELQLTETGKAQAGRYEEEQRSRTAQMFACLTQEEKVQLSEILEHLLRAWDEEFE